MATYLVSTTSNWPQLTNPDAVRELIDQWEFIPGHGSLTVKVEDDTLICYGETGFHPMPGLDEDEDPKDVAMHERTDIEGFLEELLPYLAEPLIIQTIGREKLRFPFNGTQIIADPDSNECHIGTFHSRQEEILDR